MILESGMDYKRLPGLQSSMLNWSKIAISWVKVGAAEPAGFCARLAVSHCVAAQSIVESYFKKGGSDAGCMDRS